MRGIKLQEICKKCGSHLTLMESVRSSDGTLWAVKRCLDCGGHPAEEVARLHIQRENPKPLTLALQSVQAERNRQDEKWGDQSGNHPFEWMSILGEEYGELCEAVNETFFKNGDKPERGGIDKMRKEAVQVAAVAVALIEVLDKSDHGNIHDNPELVKEG